MALTLDEIMDRVKQSEQELGDYRNRAIEWERMWRLDAGYSRSWREAVQQEGREQVTTPDPMNIVSLGMRLIDDTPHIDVPPRSQTETDIDRAIQIEKFLKGFWQYVSSQQGRNILEDAKWHALVRGCFFFQVIWAEDKYPPKMRKKKFPIIVRVLDPMCTAVKRGPLYTEWAYHRYCKDWAWVRQYYPEIAEKLIPSRHDPLSMYGPKRLDTEVTVTDFWYTDKEGIVWNALLIDDKFAKEPIEMPGYHAVPIIEGYGDSGATQDEAFRRLSILAPINGLWQYKCRLTSLQATAVLWATWPFTTIEAPGGELPPDFFIRPGETRVVPPGTKIDHHVPPVNLEVLTNITTAVDAAIQQASFPSVMYGDPSGIQSGYGVNVLQQASINRVDTPRRYLEMAVREVNEFVLCMIQENAGRKGVTLYYRDNSTKDAYSQTITPKLIDDYVCNVVTLTNTVAQDEIALLNILRTLGDGGYLSHQTVRDNINLIEVPADEQARIVIEKMLNSDEMFPRAAIVNWMKRYPDVWAQLLKGTSFEKAAQDVGLLPAPPPPPPAPQPGQPPSAPGGPPPAQGGMGPGLPPGAAPPPQGPPGPPQGPALPPGPPQGFPPGPPQGAPMGGPGGEQLPPELMALLAGQQGGGPPPGGPLQPPSLPTNADGSPMVPPAMQGQLGPQDLGLPPTGQADLNQAMMGNPMPPDEQMQYILQQAGLA